VCGGRIAGTSERRSIRRRPADHDRRPIEAPHDLCRIASRQHGQAKDTVNCFAAGRTPLPGSLEMFFDQVRDDLGIGFGFEGRGLRISSWC